MTLRLATRGSQQAQLQSKHVANLITDATGIEVELVLIETTGDRIRDRPLHDIGGRGLFTKEVQTAVLEGRADIAVHSAKDLPSSWITPGLVLAAVPERGDPRDALVGCAVANLGPGATVATGSVRRKAQLAHLRPDLTFVGLRGNIPTRVARARDHDVDAVMVAVAGVTWVGLEAAISQRFDVDEMIPQVGQGALAIECQSDDHRVLEALATIEHGPSRRCVNAERAFLAELGGGCDLPVGAHARLDDGRLHVRALVAALDGSEVIVEHDEGDDASVGARLGVLLAARAVHLLP